MTLLLDVLKDTFLIFFISSDKVALQPTIGFVPFGLTDGTSTFVLFSTSVPTDGTLFSLLSIS